jgi:hypothetical protein
MLVYSHRRNPSAKADLEPAAPMLVYSRKRKPSAKADLEAAAPMLVYSRRRKPSAKAEPKPAAPMLVYSRKRKPSAKAELEPVLEPEHQSSGKRPRKMASSGKRPTAKANVRFLKKKTTNAKAPRKRVRKVVDPDDDVCVDEPDEEALALADEEELAEQEQEGAGGPPAKRRVVKTIRARGSEDPETEFVGEPAFPRTRRSTRGQRATGEGGNTRTHSALPPLLPSLFSDV